MTTSASSLLSLFRKDKRHIGKISDVLDAILGITSVLLSHGVDEKQRREQMVGRAGDCNVKYNEWSDNTTITYNTLSPFWIVSPIIMSLVSGIARNAISICGDACLTNNLLHKVSRKEIRRIINEVDYQAALRCYKNVLSPLFAKEGTDFFLSSSYRNTVSQLLEEGYQSVFNPFRCREYWNKCDSHHGIWEYHCNLHGSSKGISLYRRM